MRKTDNTSAYAKGKTDDTRLTSLMKQADALAEQGMYDEAIAHI